MRRGAAAAALFAAAFLALLLFFDPRAGRTRPLLYDSDAYYHLAVARDLAAPGPLERLPLRRSVLGESLGDKELLFHLLLVPAALDEDPIRGGRVALAALLAGLATATTLVAWPALRRWSLLLPLALPLLSLGTAWRLVRLRPELLSLLLLIVALRLAARGAYRRLGLVAALYTLSYTASHAFLGLFGLLFLAWGWLRRRWEPALVLWVVLGVGVGLVAHPQFPANLEVWTVQNVAHYGVRSAVDVGTENRSDLASVAVLANLGWILAMLALWRAASRADAAASRGVGASVTIADDTATARRTADAFGLAALVFLVLYLDASRFIVYLVPFATLWLVHELAARGLRPGSRVRLPGQRSVGSALAALVIVALALPGALREHARFRHRTTPGPRGERLADREAMARAIPAGARVAAPWRETPIYLLWAPHGSYLNVLDPTFMAMRYPAAYLAQRRIFAGQESDVPLVAAALLDSDHVLYSTAVDGPRLARRLDADPRAQRLYRGIHALWRLRPAPGAFVVDGSVAAAAATSGRGATAHPYPRLTDPNLRQLEGYVDLRRVVPRGCATFRTEVAGAEREGAAALELASAGPATLWIEERPVVTLAAGNGATIGEGARVPLPAREGAVRLRVDSCPDPAGRNGFFLVRRSAS